jgi:hypothetical protein
MAAFPALAVLSLPAPSSDEVERLLEDRRQLDFFFLQRSPRLQHPPAPSLSVAEANAMADMDPPLFDQALVGELLEAFPDDEEEEEG